MLAGKIQRELLCDYISVLHNVLACVLQVLVRAVDGRVHLTLLLERLLLGEDVGGCEVAKLGIADPLVYML